MQPERPRPPPARSTEPLLVLGRAIAERSSWLLPLAVVVGAALLGVLRGASAAILVLAGGVLLGVITLLWKSLQVLIGETPLSLEAALDLSATTAADEQKQAILRALKNLEYEKSLGKLSDDDYRELATRYRAEAKAVMRSIDDNLGPARVRAEQLIEDRLSAKAADKPKKKKKRAEGASAADEAPKAEAAEAPSPDAAAEAPSPVEASNPSDEAAASDAEADDKAPAKAAASPVDAHVACPSCSARNDADAAFCKACGSRLRPAVTTAPSEP